MLDAFMQDLLGSDETATDSRSPDRDAAQRTVTGQTPGPATQAALILVPIAGRRACRDPRRAPITGERDGRQAAGGARARSSEVGRLCFTLSRPLGARPTTGKMGWRSTTT